MPGSSGIPVVEEDVVHDVLLEWHFLPDVPIDQPNVFRAVARQLNLSAIPIYSLFFGHVLADEPGKHPSGSDDHRCSQSASCRLLESS